MTTSRRESFALGATALVMAGLAVAVIVVASLVHSHFAPREAFCDATQTASANCGLDMFLSQMSGVVRLLAIIVLVFLGVMALVALLNGALGETPARPRHSRAQARIGRPIPVSSSMSRRTRPGSMSRACPGAAPPHPTRLLSVPRPSSAWSARDGSTPLTPLSC